MVLLDPPPFFLFSINRTAKDESLDLSPLNILFSRIPTSTLITSFFYVEQFPISPLINFFFSRVGLCYQYCWLLTKHKMQYVEQEQQHNGKIVGLHSSDNGHSCNLHMCCGRHVVLGHIVRFKMEVMEVLNQVPFLEI
jgi:hypothetical protein